MVALAAIFLTSFLTALSGALMPGPLLTVTISQSARKGFWAGPLLMVGHGLLELALVAALVAAFSTGRSQLLLKPIVTGFIGLVGGAILIWMAIGMLRSLSSLCLQSDREASAGGNRLIWTGIVVSLANPYWSLWWTTIGLSFIISAFRAGVAGIAVFYLGHILADVAWYSLMAWSIAKGRRYLNDAHYRGLIGTCAGFLIVLGVSFVYYAAGKLWG